MLAILGKSVLSFQPNDKMYFSLNFVHDCLAIDMWMFLQLYTKHLNTMNV